MADFTLRAVHILLPNTESRWRGGCRYWWGGSNGATRSECLSVSMSSHAESTRLQTVVPEFFLLSLCDVTLPPSRSGCQLRSLLPLGAC